MCIGISVVRKNPFKKFNCLCMCVCVSVLLSYIKNIYADPSVTQAIDVWSEE